MLKHKAVGPRVFRNVKLRVVSGVHRCSKSSIVAKYSCFIWHFVNPIDLLEDVKGGGCLHLVVVFSLGSSPTVKTEN